MIEHGCTGRDLKIPSWRILALGITGSAVGLGDLLAGHALGLFWPVLGLTPNKIGLACTLLVRGLDVLAPRAARSGTGQRRALP